MNLRLLRLRRPPAWAALSVILVLVLGAGFGVVVLAQRLAPPPQPRLELSNPDHVALLAPVTLRFDRGVDTSRISVRLDPAVDIEVTRQPGRIVLRPRRTWAPLQVYTISAGRWTSSFQTQPPLSVAGFRVDGRVVGQAAQARTGSRLEALFPGPMLPGSVHASIDGAALAAGALTWSADGTSSGLALPALQPYHQIRVEIAPGALTAQGDLLSAGGALDLLPVATLPTNPSSGIGEGFAWKAPVEIVVDNADIASPQSGLGRADIVYEYITEGSITRFTAIYFNSVPNEVGPVRSCRMVNPYLGYAFRGLTMCSGASVGTLHYMFGNPDLRSLATPGKMNDFDRSEHFFRLVGFKPAPHNVYTSGDFAERMRAQLPQPAGAYALDPPHPDSGAGDPAGPPVVAPHSVSYTFDAGRGTYQRLDHGYRALDRVTGAPLEMKNVVLLHVPFHDAGWVEDENGSHSIWYDLLGSGPAEIYSGGRLVHATWHMGSAAGQTYSDNHTPVWFTDAAGKVLRLNSGLTWIHVLGDGQTS